MAWEHNTNSNQNRLMAARLKLEGLTRDEVNRAMAAFKFVRGPDAQAASQGKARMAKGKGIWERSRVGPRCNS